MGYIIVIEGTDGCGKQTQTERLYNRLVEEGYKVRRQSFPNYESPSASPVKMYLGGELGDKASSLDAYQASVLYAVDRLCTYLKDLKEFYENDGVIIFDRYVQSNMLHQAGKIDDEAERDRYLEWLDTLEFETLKLPRPNKVIFLDVPVEVSMRLAEARGEYKSDTKKDIHEQDPDHIRKAYNSGKYVSDKYNWEVIGCVDNDNLRTIEDIHEDIYSRVISELKIQGERL